MTTNDAGLITAHICQSTQIVRGFLLKSLPLMLIKQPFRRQSFHTTSLQWLRKVPKHGWSCPNIRHDLLAMAFGNIFLSKLHKVVSCAPMSLQELFQRPDTIVTLSQCLGKPLFHWAIDTQRRCREGENQNNKHQHKWRAKQTVAAASEVLLNELTWTKDLHFLDCQSTKRKLQVLFFELLSKSWHLFWITTASCKRRKKVNIKSTMQFELPRVCGSCPAWREGGLCFPAHRILSQQTYHTQILKFASKEPDVRIWMDMPSHDL